MAADTQDMPPDPQSNPVPQLRRFNFLARDRRLGLTISQRRLKNWGAGYTRFVQVTKFSLPVAVLMLIGMVVIQLSEDPLEKVVEAPRKENTAPGQIELVAPQYEGVDDQGRLYTVIAEKASRDMQDDKKVLLSKLKADMTLEDGAWVSAAADTGTYGTEDQQLSLEGNVSIFYDNGYEMHLQTADIDLKSRKMHTELPVEVQGPLGRIEGKNMHVADEGARVIFGGPVKMSFYNVKGQK